MNQERIDLDALFDQQEPSQPVPQKPSKKPLVLILASVLVLAVLAAGAYLYWRFTDTSDPIRITVYKAPLTWNTFYDYTPTNQEIMDQIFIRQITDGYRCYYIKDVAFEESYSVSDSNFWIFIEPNSWAVKEDWTVDTQVESICSADIHKYQLQPQIGYYKLLDEKLEFDGWLVCGSLPRSADLRIQLNNGSGKEVSSQTVHIDPYISLFYEPYYYTKVTAYTLELLNYAVHLQELPSLVELPVEERMSAYMKLSDEHPALLLLLHQSDFHLAVEAYESIGDPVCKTYAEKLDPLFSFYREHPEYVYYRNSNFISTAEAAAMDTQSLVEYLAYHPALRNYIIMNSYSNTKFDKNEFFSYLVDYCEPIQELKNREDAVTALLPLVPESLVAKNLITLPEIQRSIKLDEIESYLMALLCGKNIGMYFTDVINLLTNMDDMSYLAISGTLEETLRDIPLFQRESFKPTTISLTSFFSRLRNSHATDKEKAVATAFLSMPGYQQLMNKTQKKLFEESKVNLTP